ncbi:nucleotidyltransferase family protein [Nannocystis punicea]|uniref:Nucleotidyltransferase family protein n=1 Tax=Nannocystis punicea TaxID=2995304 RepID=A0ABY7H233_9BACT|nr:nucleotidyltransferase family protein [Nannocystis poenicansa]WAS93329.1 nucleotidyltransferase family protein [Nannocystis poenicansa]
MTALGAVVLAAGAGERMGRPKALIEWRGLTFVRHVVAQAEAAAVSPIVVVEGAVVIPAEDLGPAIKVTNPTWPKGQMDSLRRGLLELDMLAPGCAALVLTVDRPHVRPETVAALAAAFRAAPTHVWQPAYAGRRGHPLVWPAMLLPELLALGPDESPRDLLGRPSVSGLRRVLEVDDPAVLDNLDRPADLARLP